LAAFLALSRYRTRSSWRNGCHCSRASRRTIEVVGESVGGTAPDAKELALGVEVFDEAETEEAVAGAGSGGSVGELLDDKERFGVGHAADEDALAAMFRPPTFGL
jgi:hypothetical protein